MTETRPPTMIESPYAGKTDEEVDANVAYAWRCVADSLARGEAPFAGHLFYTVPLDDKIVGQRHMGIESHKAWLRRSERVAVYEDHGVTPGMAEAIELATELGIPVETRRIG